MAGIFGDTPGVLVVALGWGFVGENKVWRVFSLLQWPQEHGDSPMAELQQSEKDRRSPLRNEALGHCFRAR